MVPLLSRDQMRAFDARAIESGVPGIVLMENAGRGAADVIARLLGDRHGALAGARVLVLCGAGNNGGDGYVVARHLRARGASPSVLSTSPLDALRGDARLAYGAFLGLGAEVGVLDDEHDLTELDLALGESELVVDALLGTGLQRDVSGLLRAVIERLNASRVPCVALDLPSGLDADRGAALGAAVRAQHTVTFGRPKLGLYTTSGALHAGVVHVAELGVPAAPPAEHSADLVEAADVAALISPREASAHKGTAGRVLVVAGSPGKIGAALLVARGALRAGAGLVTLAATEATAAALDQRVLEAMTARIDASEPERSLDALCDSSDVVVVGPGLGTDERARRIARHVVLRTTRPVVVDADALTHFVADAAELALAAGPRVLTPHAGELGRLLGVSASEVEQDRFAALARAVTLTHSVILLKGPRTLIGAPGELPLVNGAGHRVLATGGSGDVLAGVIGALCVALSARDAAVAGAFVHGRAGERWAERTGADRGLLAHEIADELPAVFAALARVRDLLPD